MVLPPVTSAEMCSDTYEDVIRFPLEIPANQRKYDATTTDDMLLGIGNFKEDHSSSYYWFRKIQKDKGIQTLSGLDPLASSEILTLQKQHTPVKWEDEVFMIPQAWFQLSQEHYVLDHLVKAIEKSDVTLRTQVAVAVRTQYLHQQTKRKSSQGNGRA